MIHSTPGLDPWCCLGCPWNPCSHEWPHGYVNDLATCYMKVLLSQDKTITDSSSYCGESSSLTKKRESLWHFAVFARQGSLNALIGGQLCKVAESSNRRWWPQHSLGDPLNVILGHLGCGQNNRLLQSRHKFKTGTWREPTRNIAHIATEHLSTIYKWYLYANYHIK